MDGPNASIVGVMVLFAVIVRFEMLQEAMYQLCLTHDGRPHQVWEGGGWLPAKVVKHLLQHSRVGVCSRQDGDVSEPVLGRGDGTAVGINSGGGQLSNEINDTCCFLLLIIALDNDGFVEKRQDGF